MTKTKNRFGILNFGHCDLFDICDLRFGISDTPVLQDRLSSLPVRPLKFDLVVLSRSSVTKKRSRKCFHLRLFLASSYSCIVSDPSPSWIGSIEFALELPLDPYRLLPKHHKRRQRKWHGSDRARVYPRVANC